MRADLPVTKGWCKGNDTERVDALAPRIPPLKAIFGALGESTLVMDGKVSKAEAIGLFRADHQSAKTFGWDTKAPGDLTGCRTARVHVAIHSHA